MRIIDADKLMEHVWRDKLDSSELIAEMINNAPTVKEIPTNIPIDVFEKLISQEPKTGHWVEENINEWSRKVFCSECGCPPPFEHISNGDVYSASGYGVSNKTKYCPNCGAKMFEPQESEGEE